MIRDKVKDITAGRKKSCQCIIAAPLSPPRIVPAPVLPLPLWILVEALNQSADVSTTIGEYIGTRSLYFKWIVFTRPFLLFLIASDGSRPISWSARNQNGLIQ